MDTEWFVFTALISTKTRRRLRFASWRRRALQALRWPDGGVPGRTMSGSCARPRARSRRDGRALRRGSLKRSPHTDGLQGPSKGPHVVPVNVREKEERIHVAWYQVGMSTTHVASFAVKLVEYTLLRVREGYLHQPQKERRLSSAPEDLASLFHRCSRIRIETRRWRQRG